MPKPLLSASIILNLILGTLLFLSLRSADISHLPIASQSPASAPKNSSPEPSADSSFHPVRHWKDLDSDEFPAFIRNLRSFGCPEQTIRDIVTAEVNRDFEQKLADLNSTHLAPGEYAQSKQRLDEERRKVLEELFPSGASTLASTHSPQTSGGQPDGNVQDQPVATPLILLQPDPSLHLDEAQVNAWKELQRSFIAKLGNTSQNPYDPEYRKRWDEAQKDLDQAFQSKFGDDAFNLLLEKRKVADAPAAPGH